MSKITDAEANATSLDGLVNDNALVPTLRNGPKPSYQYLVDGWNTEFNALIDNFEAQGVNAITSINADVVTVDTAKNSALDYIDDAIVEVTTKIDGFNSVADDAISDFEDNSEASITAFEANSQAAIIEMQKSRGLRVVGKFADGFTYELANDVGIDLNGEAWRLTDIASLPFTVPAGTTPTDGVYTKTTYNSAENVQMANGESVEKQTTQSRQAIEAVYKAQGYNNVFFFEDGFTYVEANDVGIYEDGTAWTYTDVGALPVTIAAGTVPSEGVYKSVKVKASSVEIGSGGSVQNEIDFKNGLTASEAVNYEGIDGLLGSRVWLADRQAWFDVVLTSTVTPDGGARYIESISNPLYSLSLIIEDNSFTLVNLGAKNGDVEANTNAWLSAAELLNQSKGTLKVTHDQAPYSVNKGAGIFSGTVIHDDDSPIINVANDSVNFWNNTAVFYGTYFGFDSAQGVVAEPSYMIDDVSIYSNEIKLTNTAETSNFTVGQVVFIHGGETYGTTSFYTESHISVITEINSSTGVLKLRDKTEQKIDSGSGQAYIYGETGSLTNAGIEGRPEPVKLAKNVQVINGQYESVNTSFSQVVHMSLFDCRMDFEKIKGRALSGINPSASSHINIRNGQYYTRGFELAYFHHDITSDVIKIRRAGLPNPLTTASLPFICSEYGNKKNFGIIDVEDESWPEDGGNSAVTFSTPLNIASQVIINGSQLNGLSTVSGRADSTYIKYLDIKKTTNHGAVIDSNDVVIDYLQTGAVSSSGYSALIKDGVERCHIKGGKLGGGAGSGPENIIQDENGFSSSNRYQNVVNHYSQNPFYRAGIDSKTSDGSESFYSVAAGTTNKAQGFEFIIKGNVPPSSTSEAKSITLAVAGLSVTLSLLSSDTGFFEIRAKLTKQLAQTLQLLTSEVLFNGSIASAEVQPATVNMATTTVTASAAWVVGGGDTINIRELQVKPFNDQFNFDDV